MARNDGNNIGSFVLYVVALYFALPAAYEAGGWFAAVLAFVGVGVVWQLFMPTDN